MMHYEGILSYSYDELSCVAVAPPPQAKDARSICNLTKFGTADHDDHHHLSFMAFKGKFVVHHLKREPFKINKERISRDGNYNFVNFATFLE